MYSYCQGVATKISDEFAVLELTVAENRRAAVHIHDGREPEVLKEPVTLIVEDNAGSRARATVFCRVESRGVRTTPALSRDVKPEVLYDGVLERFGFRDPYAVEGRVDE